MIGHSFTAPAACGGLPLPPLRGPPPPSTGVGKFMEEKGTASLHPLPTPETGVGGERLYTLLRPPACHGGEGHAVARGDCQRHAACGS